MKIIKINPKHIDRLTAAVQNCYADDAMIAIRLIVGDAWGQVLMTPKAADRVIAKKEYHRIIWGTLDEALTLVDPTNWGTAIVDMEQLEIILPTIQSWGAQ